MGVGDAWPVLTRLSPVLCWICHCSIMIRTYRDYDDDDDKSTTYYSSSVKVTMVSDDSNNKYLAINIVLHAISCARERQAVHDPSTNSRQVSPGLSCRQMLNITTK